MEEEEEEGETDVWEDVMDTLDKEEAWPVGQPGGAPPARPGAPAAAAAAAAATTTTTTTTTPPPPPLRRPRASAFYLLVSALATSDLLGKCLVSPIVLAAYARNRSLSELWPAPTVAEQQPPPQQQPPPPPPPPPPGGGTGVATATASVSGGPAVEGASPGGEEEPRPGCLCQLFAFLMAFFGLAPTVLLLAMAVECWLSLGLPYFYEHHTSRRRGALLTGGAVILCALFCALPFFGFGATVQYCPGTWCFVRMTDGGGSGGRTYSVLYASLLGLLVLAIATCNLGSMRSLYRMARRQPLPRRNRGARHAAAADGLPLAPDGPPRLEELGQLVLLALMTVLFTVCSLPVIIRAYVGAFAPDYDEKADLTALRFFSVNSIVDPWVFIIFRTSVFRSCLRRLSWRMNARRVTHSHLLETCPRKESDSLQAPEVNGFILLRIRISGFSITSTFDERKVCQAAEVRINWCMKQTDTGIPVDLGKGPAIVQEFGKVAFMDYVAQNPCRTNGPADCSILGGIVLESYFSKP
ncbi:hypothetical protein JRQ81_001334 [Phrynocephalus forsythii]|uniref:G-protein coupled receptors family 1 profile domain-containing protein n=1 Tax=Phrynocephalus forsythii TaxID=171643 RepID=A0A9Q0YAI5_9SAUR|nr:hypothetical protein JRQ81_001334 [Phrynocephalus forsythii]